MKCFVTVVCLFLMFLDIIHVCHSNTAPNFTADADAIKKVMDRSELRNEQNIIDILVERSNDQRQEIIKEYKKIFNLDLVEELRKFFIYDIREAIMSLLVPNDHFYTYQLHHAIEGFGTDEIAISEVLGSMNNDEILNISATYENDYRVTLKEDLKSDTSGPYMNLLLTLCDAERNEDQVDEKAAIKDAHALKSARASHSINLYHADESIFKTILMTRSRPQLKLTFHEYAKITNSTIVQTIEEEFNGDVQYIFMIIVKSVMLSKPMFYAIQLRESMLGIGTNDRQLIRIIVGRSEIDLKEIATSYKTMFGTALVDSVADDTSGKYKNLLLSVIRK